MKKLVFFTRIRVNGIESATRVAGYTDGVFNYYKDRFGRWFAICPHVGLAVISGLRVSAPYTRKAAQAEAFDCIEDINKWLNEHGEQQTAVFQELVKNVDAT